MRNKSQIRPVELNKKPPKAEVTETEFRRRLKKIADWRKQRLAELRSKNPR